MYTFVQASQETTKLCNITQHQDARDDILTWFKVRDALDISWLHAVNSPKKLEQGLSGEIMMLEADVLMRNNQVCQEIHQLMNSLFNISPTIIQVFAPVKQEKNLKHCLHFASDLVIN